MTEQPHAFLSRLRLLEKGAYEREPASPQVFPRFFIVLERAILSGKSRNSNTQHWLTVTCDLRHGQIASHDL